MSEAPPAPRKRRRWLRWTLYVLAALGLAVFLLFRDVALEPADDLMPKMEPVAWDETNGWKRMLDIQKRYPETSWSDTSRLNEAVDMKMEMQPADLQKLILPETELAEMEAIAALPLFTNRIEENPVAAIHSGGRGSGDLRVRLHATVLAGMEAQSPPLVIRCLRLAAALQRRQVAGAAGMGDLLRAMSWGSEALTARALVKLELPDAVLPELAALFSTDPFTTDELHSAMRHEFRIDRIVLSKAKAPPGLESEGLRFLFQRNRTQNRLAHETRNWLRMAGTVPWAEIKAYKLPLEERRKSYRYFLNPNAAGEGSLEMMILAPGAWEDDLRARLALRRELQVVIALHRFQKARGKVPESIAELVPEFLPAIPNDPFDFQPLRWDAAKRIVYSIGTNDKPKMSPEMDSISSATGWKPLTWLGRDHPAMRFRTLTEGPDAPPAPSPPPGNPRTAKPVVR